MNTNVYKKQIIMFISMIIVGMLFNPMNMLAYRISDVYVSLTLFYGGLLMASNMMWSHQLIHYISMGHFNMYVFAVGIVLSIVSVILLRTQFMVNDPHWLKRMIGHHSTALTTTHQIYTRTENSTLKKLATDIIDAQEKEITQMKSML